jgi:hypothetical protein
VTARQLNAEHPQELQDLTHTLPDAEPTVTVILVVPWPAVIVQPAGTVQVYDDAPETADMLYVTEAPTHGVVVPVIAPGVAGAVIGVTVKQPGGLDPQPLSAVTQTLPAVEPTVTLIEVVPCPELITHPLGTVHV